MVRESRFACCLRASVFPFANLFPCLRARRSTSPQSLRSHAFLRPVPRGAFHLRRAATIVAVNHHPGMSESDRRGLLVDGTTTSPPRGHIQSQKFMHTLLRFAKTAIRQNPPYCCAASSQVETSGRESWRTFCCDSVSQGFPQTHHSVREVGDRLCPPRFSPVSALRLLPSPRFPCPSFEARLPAPASLYAIKAHCFRPWRRFCDFPPSVGSCLGPSPRVLWDTPQTAPRAPKAPREQAENGPRTEVA